MPRVVGPKHEIHDFPAFAAVALAGIGTDWPDTIMDRAIVINMERKTNAETVQRYRRDARAAMTRIGTRLADSLARVETFTADDLPEELSDRQQDGWEPLIAIARAAGGDWPRRARRTAISLSGAAAWITEEREELIALRDVRAVFEARDNPAFIGSKEVLFAMFSIEESPWLAEPRPLTLHKLGKLMGQFNIKSHQPINTGPRGYYLADIERHWGRLRTNDDSLAGLVPTPTKGGETDG